MKAILDRLDFATTWLLIALVFITGFAFGQIVADKTTPKSAELRAADPLGGVDAKTFANGPLAIGVPRPGFLGRPIVGPTPSGRLMRDTNATGVCIIYLFDDWTKTNGFRMTVENISNPCNFSTNRHADSTATNMILRVSHEPIVRRASNSWEITFRERSTNIVAIEPIPTTNIVIGIHGMLIPGGVPIPAKSHWPFYGKIIDVGDTLLNKPDRWETDNDISRYGANLIHVEKFCDHEPSSLGNNNGPTCIKCGKPIKAVYK